MPDAADRIRSEPKVALRAKPARARAFLPKSKRTIAGAALAAMMIGIVVNAVALQHGRRIELGLAPDPTAVAAIKPVAPAPKPEPIREPPRPQSTMVALAHPQKSGDAIADFLRAQGTDKRRLTLAAQGELAKLGFPVKATGALDAETRSAMVAFEKSRHMAASTEITAKLVHSLKAAVAAN